MKKKNNSRFRFSLWYILGALLLLAALQSFVTTPGAKKISYAEFIQLVEDGQIRQVSIGEGRLTAYQNLPDPAATGRDQGQVYLVNRVDDPELVNFLKERGIDFEGRVENTWLTNFLFGWMLPLAVMLAIWGFIFRRMGRGGAGGVLAFGKSKARIYAEGDNKTTFADVAGAEEAKEELAEIIEFLRHPQRYARLGGRIPKGVLLVGAPGTGKTLLARAVAGEAAVPFYSMSGSGFVEMFVGVGASRVRDLFEQASNNAPCIIFIDEIDALGRARGTAMITGNDEREQTLNQLLAEMDGFESNKGVIILAATNRPEILDTALLRAGRFDRHVMIGRPDLNERLAILEVHARRVTLDPEVDLKVVAARTPGLVGADLANLINEAALLAARDNKDAVTMVDLEKSVDRVMAGLEKKSRVMSEKDKKIVAFHEVGHALVAESVETADKVQKVSIVPRGIGALG
ncbi:MAG: ATP-dependent zinc metalloprotease FtsH, partial [Deltaproteobacteria bacterium]|nr:ATP-dependent zinc metalloprotease FtsH [Deltaproteobacteria bacterium]